MNIHGFTSLPPSLPPSLSLLSLSPVTVVSPSQPPFFQHHHHHQHILHGEAHLPLSSLLPHRRTLCPLIPYNSLRSSLSPSVPLPFFLPSISSHMPILCFNSQASFLSIILTHTHTQQFFYCNTPLILGEKKKKKNHNKDSCFLLLALPFCLPCPFTVIQGHAVAYIHPFSALKWEWCCFFVFILNSLY